VEKPALIFYVDNNHRMYGIISMFYLVYTCTVIRPTILGSSNRIYRCWKGLLCFTSSRCDQRICLFVCLSVGVCQKPHFQISRNFHTCYLWTWLDPPLTTDILCTSSFVDDVVLLHNGANGQNQRWRICFVEFARWRHQGRSLLFPTESCFVTI